MVSFSRGQFSGGKVDFGVAEFSGGTVSFSAARFPGGDVDFSAAQFSGGTVDFSDVGDWSFPPAFPRADASPAGVKLPGTKDQPQP